MNRILSTALIGVFVLISPAARATDCVEAEWWFQQARHQPDSAEANLVRAIDLCPTHASALNNLALIREGQQRIPEAAALYRRATEAAPDYATPYAGLGDSLAALGRPNEAASAYRLFLDLLPEEAQRGDPDGLVPHEADYRQRYRQALADGRAKGPIPAAAITRSLTIGETGSLARSIRPRYKKPARIEIKILFASDSARLSDKATAQLRQVAASLGGPRLARAKIRIEGHTDSTASRTHNQDLSERRAAAVKDWLVGRGLDGGRLQVVGKGETDPLESNKTAAGRALNRRVTFINVGRHPL